mgnify:CR=1 FL=1
MNYRVAVRALCAFTAREGDLDLRFTPAPSPQEGIAGHQVVTGRRGAHYLSELALSGEYRGLLVSGRADGYDPVLNRLEEIKTHRGKVERIADNQRRLHWAQVKVYGWLLCASRQLPEIELAVVYYNINTQKETACREQFRAGELRAFFELQCERFLDWAQQELEHRQARDASLEQLEFPWPSFRTGQRQLAAEVYRATRDGKTLLAQATTGIGKTLGTLFPQLKAFPGQRLDRLFYLTARTPGRQLALDALATLHARQPQMPLRVLEHIARDKACEHPQRACHGESCPLARGFHDRLPAARQVAVAARWLTRERVREIALTHDICPYYLSQELCHWADVVVADYNYYFDSSALLHALTLVNDWRVTLLVDEAHNLVERGRSMYSAELDQQRLHGLRSTAPAALGPALDRLERHWRQLVRDQQHDYQVQPQLPDLFMLSLQKLVGAITDHLAEQPEGNDAALLRFYLDALLFCRLAEHFAEHSIFDISLRRHGRRRLSTLCLRNLLPAPFLRGRFAAAHSSTLFSATLTPARYQQDMLGLPEGTRWLDVASPFSPEQLQVRYVSNLSTRYQHRADSLLPICQLIAEQYRQRPGNYLAFFSSYRYLEQVVELLQSHWPGIPLQVQSAGMDEAARRAFLDSFTGDSRQVGFAVLGGAFGEGIDLPGERLIGAFIATLGLPQVNPVTEQIRARMDQLFGHGHDYAYLFPGLQKVVQAAGRVIRSPEDQGVLWLLDDRFGQPRVRQLLPGWWQVERHHLAPPMLPGRMADLFSE